ncbi:MAG: V-type ATP synthase subunit D [Oscillospiraceae bacterium]|jgi:V/A-type H+-transporting ATPase subunit D|nr:V-type ATP synthase subunit D [Oscillospiraceae bacterium]
MPNTAPTKGNLMALNRTLTLARTGYELMDRKRNILIREMMRLIDAAAALQSRIDSTFAEAYQALQIANIALGTCRSLADNMPLDTSVQIRFRSVMGVEIPYVTADSAPPAAPLGFISTNSDFDEAVAQAFKAKRLITEMAEVETSIYRLAYAIKKTQKRANALQNVIIPDLTAKVKFITAALEEKEREEFVRMKVIKARG